MSNPKVFTFCGEELFRIDIEGRIDVATGVTAERMAEALIEAFGEIEQCRSRAERYLAMCRDFRRIYVSNPIT